MISGLTAVSQVAFWEPRTLYLVVQTDFSGFAVDRQQVCCVCISFFTALSAWSYSYLLPPKMEPETGAKHFDHTKTNLSAIFLLCVFFFLPRKCFLTGVFLGTNLRSVQGQRMALPPRGWWASLGLWPDPRGGCPKWPRDRGQQKRRNKLVTRRGPVGSGSLGARRTKTASSRGCMRWVWCLCMIVLFVNILPISIRLVLFRMIDYSKSQRLSSIFSPVFTAAHKKALFQLPAQMKGLENALLYRPCD